MGLASAAGLVAGAGPSPGVLLEKRPLERRGARIARPRTDAVGAGRRARPRVIQARERAELDLPVAGAAVVEVALPIVATRTGLRDGAVRRLTAVLLCPQRGRRREAALRGAVRVVAPGRDERVGRAVKDDDRHVPRRASAQARDRAARVRRRGLDVGAVARDVMGEIAPHGETGREGVLGVEALVLGYVGLDGVHELEIHG